MQYSYTIYDANPDGGGARLGWMRGDAAIEASNSDEALLVAAQDALSLAEQSGEHEPGDDLWIRVWDDEGRVVCTTVIGDTE